MVVSASGGIPHPWGFSRLDSTPPLLHLITTDAALRFTRFLRHRFIYGFFSALSSKFDCGVFAKSRNMSDFDIKNSYCRSTNSLDSSVYRGPLFSTLDPNLQHELKQYLVARGIEESLTNFLIFHLHKKEQDQYVASQSLQVSSILHHYANWFHFYADDMTRQVESHHFCAHQNEDMRQCLIYDSPNPNARLIGVEYMVSENIFMTLPDEEKPMWHSHDYEVKSGILFTPGVPGPIARQDLEKVAKTYGKTYHFWQVDRGDTLPLGIPQLMMSFTRDGQLHDHLARDVEKRFGVSFEKERENRAYIEGYVHGTHPLANAAGKGRKTVLRETDCQPLDSVPRVFV